MKAILSTYIPQNSVRDRIAWTHSNDGKYNVKSGYQLWFNHFSESGSPVHSRGWNRLLKLDVPHKVKIFFWHFSHNTILVRNLLRSNGVRVPIYALCVLRMWSTRFTFYLIVNLLDTVGNKWVIIMI